MQLPKIRQCFAGGLAFIVGLLMLTAEKSAVHAESGQPFEPVLVMAQSCGPCINLIRDRRLRYSNPELLFAMAADGRAFRQDVKAGEPFSTLPLFKTMQFQPAERD